MITNLKFILFLLILFFIHLLFYQYLVLGEVYPDLFLVLVVYCALRWGPDGGSISGFICGIIQDSFSYTYFGLHAVAKIIIGFAIGKVRHSFFSNKYIVQAAIILTSKILHDIIFYSIYFSRGEESFWRQMIFHTAPSAFYTCILGVALFIMFRFKAATKSW